MGYDIAVKGRAQARINFVLHERLHDLVARLGLDGHSTGEQIWAALDTLDDDDRATDQIHSLWLVWALWKAAGMDPEKLDPIERVLLEAEATERLASPDELGRIGPTDDQQDGAAEASELLEAAGACVGDLAMSYGFDTPRGRYLGQVSELISSAQGGLRLLPGITTGADDTDDEGDVRCS